MPITVRTKRARRPARDRRSGTGGGEREDVVADTATPSSSESTQQADQAWAPVGVAPESGWVRTRRVLLVAGLAVVITVGTVHLGQTVRQWVSPQRPAAAAPAVSDTALGGSAATVALDYLSWDAESRGPRQVALARYGAPGVSIDGWNGQGRQRAEAAEPIGIHRAGHGPAIVTVRARVAPMTGATPNPVTGGPAAPSDAGPNSATAPRSSAPGVVEQPARWVTLAIPMSTTGNPRVLGQPGLVGSLPQSVSAPAVPGEAVGDDTLAHATQDTLGRLLGSYGTGDLSYARASGSRLSGLDGAATLASVQRWHVAPGTGPRRSGDATVTWNLSGGAGQLTSTYRVNLERQSDRWYLAGLTPELGGHS